jgi:hypothetical protein
VEGIIKGIVPKRDEAKPSSVQPVIKGDVYFDLIENVPKLYIKNKEVDVLSMCSHYVARNNGDEEVNMISFVYKEKGITDQKVIFINLTTGEMLN